MRRLITFLVLPAFVGSPASAVSGERSPSDVEALIAQLGSKDFKVRETAERKLLEREHATPALRAALKSRDAEVVRRAVRILGAFDLRQQKRALERLVALRTSGEVDQLIERFVAGDWDEQLEDQLWAVVVDLARDLIQREKREYHKLPDLYRTPDPKHSECPLGDLPGFIKLYRPDRIVAETPRVTSTTESIIAFVRGRQVVLNTCCHASILVSSSGISISMGDNPEMNVVHCIVLAGDAVEMPWVTRSVIVCDGDCRIKGNMVNSLVIARGNVVVEGRYANNSVIVSGGNVVVEAGDATNSVIVSGGKVRFAKNTSVTRCVLREDEPNPLGMVRFFDPARAGLEVDADNKTGVVVKKADADKPFGRGGLKSGDELVAIDGTAVASPEVFRRLLRRKLAEGKEAVFHVRRQGKTLDLKILCKD